jgi:hypothetical protein
MTMVPWQGKEGSSEHTVFTTTKPGEIVSVDQLISTQVGFIAQLKGRLTKQRYTVATVFTNHYSRLQYIHLMTQITSQETVEAKRAFEIFAKQHGVQILHYHYLLTTPSNNLVRVQGNASPSVASMLTSKMGLPRRPFMIFVKVLGSSCCTCANDGQLPSTWLSGHMLFDMPLTFSTPCQFWRIEHLDLNFSAQSKLESR